LIRGADLKEEKDRVEFRFYFLESNGYGIYSQSLPILKVTP